MREVVAAAVLAVTVAACGGGEEPLAYEVTMDVTYREELRAPGFGYVLHEFQLDYRLATATVAGELVEPEAAGTAAWTIRCYDDAFAADQVPVAEFTGTHPAIFEWERGDLRRADVLEGDVDWTAGPAVLVVEGDGELQVAHRLPAALAADREIGCDPDDQHSALALTLGGAAMTAPGRVVTDTEAFSRAEALNDAAGEARYVLDEAGSGWLVFEVPPETLSATLTPFTFTYDPGREPEGGADFVVQGTLRAAPTE